MTRITWILGRLNLEDPVTKSETPLSLPLKPTMAVDFLANDFDAAESWNGNRLLV